MKVNCYRETSYSKAVQTGFTFSMTQTLTVTASIEANFEVVKAGVSVGVSLSFTEEWSKSTTETISFEVPAGAVAFLYRGFLLASPLSYNAASGAYTFREGARLPRAHTAGSRRTPPVR